MARNYDFQPDRDRSGNFDKMLLSQRQRFGLLRWILFSVLSLLALLVQDSIVYRLDLYGASADLVPCVIIMITSLQGAEAGSIFSLIASILFFYSGSAPGPMVVALLPILSILVTIFRQAYLRRGFFSILLSTAMGMVLYELSLFGIGLFLDYTISQWFPSAVLTAALSLCALPVAYPIARSISKIGGQTWKE